MNNVEKVTKETILNGGVLANLYFDVHTKSKEKSQEIGVGFVNSLLKEQGVVYALGEIEEPIQNGDLFSTSLVVKILVKSFPYLTNICATHSPFSIEILRPNEIRMPLNQAHELLSTVAATTSDYKKYILERVTTKEELQKYQKIMEQKAELGRRVLGRSEKQKEERKEEDKKEG